MAVAKKMYRTSFRGGMFLMPSAPLVMLVALVMMMRMISEKPKVAMAR